MDLALAVLTGLLVGALLGHATATARRAAAGAALGAQVAALEARLETERRLAAERLSAAADDERRSRETFRALASEVLAGSSEHLLSLAEQRLGAATAAGDAALAGREHAVRSLVEPIATVLDEVRAQVTEAERRRATEHAALEAQLRGMHDASAALRTETARLVNALRSSQVRGRWGELQLRRVVEAAGMLAHVDFVEQAAVRTDDGLLRPDMVVHLGGGKRVVLDAKVAFLAFLEAMEATDEEERRRRLADHARALRRHVDDLAAKRYWEQLAPTPELVVMFVPAEAFLHAAVDVDPGLYEYAMERNVVLATPMTLVALLRTVAHTWRQEALAANAQQVLDLGRELHGRLGTLAGHVGRLGRQLDGAVRAYNESVSALESRVLVSARRMSDLGVVDGELEAPAQVDRAARRPAAPELADLAALDDGDADDPDGLADVATPQGQTGSTLSDRRGPRAGRPVA